MKSDRELLEQAAKALGWRVASYSERRSTGVVDGGMAIVVAEGRTFGWSPLHNDGDALRLAVKLEIDLVFFRKHVDACAGSRSGVPITEYGVDREAVTRRAIVCAAAAIGEQQ